jgi:hypothetical protein
VPSCGIDHPVNTTHCGRALFDGLCDRTLLGDVSCDGESTGLAGDFRETFKAAVKQR